MSVKKPSLERHARMDSTAEAPTPLMPPNPNRMLPSALTVKSMPDSLTSGSRTLMPMRLHSVMSLVTSSILSLDMVKLAAMNSFG